MKRSLILLATFSVLLSGCSFQLMKDDTDPLIESVLEGKGAGKILVVTVRGMISDKPKKGMLKAKPSLIQEFVSQLKKAAEDDEVKAVIVKIDSPGGTVNASDVLYHELQRYKQKSNAKVVACFMTVAASGGYYMALPSDHIVAHPSTITGSVGAVFLRPEMEGLLGKIGIGMRVAKSGRNKDMGSPFRQSTQEETDLFQKLVDGMADDFVGRVVKHRGIEGEALKTVRTARIFTAKEAKSLGLVDQIGYMSDAIEQAKELAGLPSDAKVIAYRRSVSPNDNVYNPATFEASVNPGKLIELGLFEPFLNLQTGPYYLWAPGLPD